MAHPFPRHSHPQMLVPPGREESPDKHKKPLPYGPRFSWVRLGSSESLSSSASETTLVDNKDFWEEVIDSSGSVHPGVHL